MDEQTAPQMIAFSVSLHSLIVHSFLSREFEWAWQYSTGSLKEWNIAISTTSTIFVYSQGLNIVLIIQRHDGNPYSQEHFYMLSVA